MARRETHLPDLKGRLNAGEHVTVLEFPRNRYHIKWYMISLGTAFKISQGKGPGWVVGLIPPRGQAAAVVVGGELAVDSGVVGAVGDASVFADAVSMAGYSRGGDARKQCRQALDPTRP